MKRILITFGGAAWDSTIERIVTDAPRFGVDEVKVYDDRWLLDSPFYAEHEEWWRKRDAKYDHKNRGFGWFIWKPHVIMHAISRCGPGDIVLYVDADTYPIADLTPLYRECERIGGVMLFSAVGCNHARWCKRDCFIRMGMDDPRWRDREHAVARFMLFQSGSDLGSSILDDWQRYCLDPRCNTFDASVLAEEHPEFHEHRCEQAILTNLAHRNGLKLYREACQAGATQPEDQNLYPQLFVQVDCAGEKRDYSGSRYRNIT